MGVINFQAESVVIEPVDFKRVEVRLEADMKEVVADMDLEDRLHEIEPIDVIETVGATHLLNAMSEKHFTQWLEIGQGDFYEALNAIGFTRIQEWIDDYTGGE